MSGYLPNHLMVRFTAIAVLVTASTSTGAEQKDVLLVVLDVNGEQSMRFQPSPHGSCSKFLASFREFDKAWDASIANSRGATKGDRTCRRSLLHSSQRFGPEALAFNSRIHSYLE